MVGRRYVITSREASVNTAVGTAVESAAHRCLGLAEGDTTTIKRVGNHAH
jgi:hypothetical protein